MWQDPYMTKLMSRNLNCHVASDQISPASLIYKIIGIYPAASARRHVVITPSYKNDTLQWRHNDHDCVSNHQPDGCLLNRLSRPRSKETSKLRVTGLCVGNSPGTGKFPAHMASYAENVSIWWRHHDTKCRVSYITEVMVSHIHVHVMIHWICVIKNDMEKCHIKTKWDTSCEGIIHP